eukprot:TRINITY_DN17172_c0_g1_i1.p1 TRINITY_DN17172_c0_g1~~TRINITY_DN17172_c0_g1_i1.p1  ORF type:complete len:953 (-),score=123.85 TRINITY_DN17172_c0_g1_i1:52-2910(-)
MECFAGAAIGGGVAAKATFNYNRENFKYDRWLRMKKEFQLLKFRNEQAELWREDVRDLCSLTEYKMHVYLLVNVLMLGFAIVLWFMGRLPESTPDWIMMGNAIAVTGAFVFLVLSIWMAMHAAVSAQGYQTRMLTQLVRMPIPTWEELEACRTYASDFERCEAKQMFRVPFLMGRQEDFVSKRNSQHSGARGMHAVPENSATADPWGLERTGDQIYELGCAEGSAVAKLRHVRIARQAMAYWQTYDAFARVSMSVGVIELLLGLSYYILGYVLVQDDSRTAATYGVILLAAMAQSVMHLDMTLTKWEARIVQLAGVSAPALSCIAAYHWSYFGKSVQEWMAEALIAIAFFSHGFFIAVMTRLCRITLHDNGSMLPSAYRSVLYLDVFGWVRSDSSSMFSDEHSTRSSRRSRIGETPDRLFDSSESSNEMPPGDEYLRPATASINFAANGAPIPLRPEDVAPPQAKEDLRDEIGAPTGSYGRSANTEFFSAKYWMQGEASRPAHRCDCGSIFMDDSFFCRRCGRKRREVTPKAEDDRLEVLVSTGHEAHSPGILPWHVFSGLMVMLCLAWMAGGTYHALIVTRLVEREAPVVWESDPKSRRSDEPWEREISVGKDVSLLSVAQRGQFARATRVKENVEAVPIAWPHMNFRPQSLTCDASGHKFVVTDRLRTLVAEADSKSSTVKAQSFQKKRHRVNLRAAWKMLAPLRGRAQEKPSLVNFTALSCPAIDGEGLQDAALSCHGLDGDQTCHAIVLHRQGRRISACPVKGSRDDGNIVASLSRSWLDAERHSSAWSNKGDEKAVALTIDPRCWTGLGVLPTDCRGAFAGTTRGRVVQLQQHSQKQELIPEEALEESAYKAGKVDEGLHAGAVRVLGDGYLGILRGKGQEIDVLDLQRGGAPTGKIRLPDGRHAVSFCSGGGYLYFIGEGPSPRMFRVPLPSVLEPHDELSLVQEE